MNTSVFSVYNLNKKKHVLEKLVHFAGTVMQCYTIYSFQNSLHLVIARFNFRNLLCLQNR